MAERDYRVLVAKDRDGLLALARPDWKLLENTIREFSSLNTHDDLSLGDVGRVVVDGAGWVALAFRV